MKIHQVGPKIFMYSKNIKATNTEHLKLQFHFYPPRLVQITTIFLKTEKRGFLTEIWAFCPLNCSNKHPYPHD